MVWAKTGRAAMHNTEAMQIAITSTRFMKFSFSVAKRIGRWIRVKTATSLGPESRMCRWSNLEQYNAKLFALLGTEGSRVCAEWSRKD